MTGQSATLNPVTPRELLWAEFLDELRLSPGIDHDLYHKILRNELELHDLFVSGQMRLIDIRLMLSFD